MQVRISVRVLLIITVLVHSWFGAAYAYAESTDDPDAKQIVDVFQAQLLDAMKLKTYSERYQTLSEPVLSSHDLTFIIRVGIRNEWKKLSKPQKQQLVDVFSRLAIAEYAKHFKDFSGESFIFDSQEETRQGGIVVRMRLLLNEDEEVKFSYSMKKRRGAWKILFITAKGVNQSLVRTKEYDSILRNEGFDTLIAKISGKIEKYSKQ